ncbi:hypothetical protein JCM14713_07800 [Desulfomicrobium salsuginis]
MPHGRGDRLHGIGDGRVETRGVWVAEDDEMVHGVPLYALSFTGFFRVSPADAPENREWDYDEPYAT